MQKEMLLAVIIGLGFGLVITFGFYQARQTSRQVSQGTQITASPIPETPAPNPEEISVTSPQLNQVTTESSISVSGVTLPNNFVTIVVNDQPFFTTSDDSGNFATSVELSQTANIITIITTNSLGASTQIQRSVVYLDNEIAEILSQPASASADATSSAQVDTADDQ